MTDKDEKYKKIKAHMDKKQAERQNTIVVPEPSELLDEG